MRNRIHVGATVRHQEQFHMVKNVSRSERTVSVIQISGDRIGRWSVIDTFNANVVDFNDVWEQIPSEADDFIHEIWERKRRG